MIKKATPAQNPLPVKSQTITAMMVAGKKKNKTLAISSMMIIPITTRINNPIKSKTLSKGIQISSTNIVFQFLHLNFQKKEN